MWITLAFLRTGAELSKNAHHNFTRCLKCLKSAYLGKGGDILSKPKKSTLIKKEKDRLLKICESMNPAVLDSVEGLIDNLSWLRVELDLLREDINENGYTELFQQSEKVPPYNKERVQVSEYDKWFKNYVNGLKQLISKLPDDSQAAAMDELQAFMSFKR